VVRFRAAGPADAGAVAGLHADSWRRHYRGAYADAYLDGDVEADRRAVWAERLTTASMDDYTVVADEQQTVVGFAHTMLSADPVWGALLDNLHVAHGHKRGGIGATLLKLSAEFVADRAPAEGLHLWVLEQNTAAQAFYRALGGECVERGVVPPPGGVEGRLNGEPACLRFVWREPRKIV
jgi:ribosomal protein S18 acetylase RimI-like enzyme